VSYTPRLYPDVVRDLISVMTGGTVAETLPAPPEGLALVPAKLRDRPVRFVSHLQGEVGEPGSTRPFRFTAADFELVASGEDGLDTIRFRDGGRRPTPGTDLTVNYYPVVARPAPVDDLSVGSVARTLVETVSYEIAVLYQHLDVVYRSAFVDTAEGLSLDRVVALVGVGRLPAGYPVASLRFERAAGAAGRVSIPAGTAVTNADGARYLTQETIVLEPGEGSRDVTAIAATPVTAEAEAGALDRLEVLIAGIDRVSNPQAARRLTTAETDAELRRRAKAALAGAPRGTLDALRFHLLSMPEVKDVTLTEAPDGRGGEVRADIAYHDDSPAARQRVADRIAQVKPAGVVVLAGAAARRRVAVRVGLVLAGAGVSGRELGEIQSGVVARLTGLMNATPPGGIVRRARLIAAAMADARIIDATVTLTPEGGTPAEELTLASGEMLEIVTPIGFEPATAEQTTAIAREAVVAVVLPIRLAPGSTTSATRGAIEVAVLSHLASRSNGASLTLDGLAAAIRDDTRFALLRAEATITVETEDRFLQLSDGVGEYAPGPGETLRLGRLDLDVREGTV